jgi:hypothetical protein
MFAFDFYKDKKWRYSRFYLLLFYFFFFECISENTLRTDAYLLKILIRLNALYIRLDFLPYKLLLNLLKMIAIFIKTPYSFDYWSSVIKICLSLDFITSFPPFYY